MQGKFRRYTITLNNYTQAEYDTWWTLECRYMILGKEVGENGTPHIQGYVEFVNQRSFSSVTKIVPRSHIEVANGDSEQNRRYCSKDNDWQERGERTMTQADKGESEKRRWEDAFEAAKEGRMDDIDAEIKFKHYGIIKRIQKDYQVDVPDLEDVTGVWYYGAAGAGKTHKAIADYPKAYRKLCNKWWDGYQDEDHVLIDDVDPAHACLVQHFKHWADRYAFNAEVKGGQIRIRPKVIIFTSQYSIEECFQGKDQASIDAIKRRCKVVHVTNWRQHYNAPRASVTATTPPIVAAPPAILPTFNPGPQRALSLESTALSLFDSQPNHWDLALDHEVPQPLELDDLLS